MIQKGQILGIEYLCVEGGSEWIEAQSDPAFRNLFPDRVVVAAIPPDTSPATSSKTVKVYTAKPGTQWRLALIALVLAVFGLIPLKSILGWLSGGPRPQGGAFLAAAGALFFLLIGIRCAANALRGLPRLTVTPEGVKLEGGLRTKRTNWEGVGPFAVKTVYSSRFRQVRTASAKIAESGAGRSGRVRIFAIPNHFAEPIDAIAAELNAARARAIGDTTPADTDSDLKEASIGLAEFRVPWVTFTLMAVLIVVFALENTLAVTPGAKALTPSIATLYAFGALSRKAVVANGEWYRLFTAPLLHANLAHLLGNGVALVWGGWLLERLVGRVWFFAFFAVGALGGSLFSLAVNPINLVSVGASGALMGLFAALFVGSFRLASGTANRTRLQVNSARILVPSLLPIFQSSSVVHIDYGAHIGGALSGTALALLLLKFWPESARIPQLRTVAAVISAIGAFLFIASGGLAIGRYPGIVHALKLAKPAAPSSSTEVLSDHGPKRIACDFKWGTLQQRDRGPYLEFLQKCMKADSAVH
ncbi:MAG TPA: rhomboid family intramembrane serine protease [Xanthobacteraceae bacterium]